MPVTQFQPSRHGFHFSNNDLNLPQKGGTVLCGGMAYSAIDYFLNGMTIPHDIEAPANGTPLNDYIFQRQVAAHISTANKFAAIFVPIPLLSPLLSGVSTFPDVEFNKLVGKLGTGKPCAICLANPGFSGHHLVAMGCNDKPPITITAYDPNAPGKTAIIQEFKNATGSRTFRNSADKTLKQWENFFVDTGFQPERPTVLAGQDKWQWCGACMGLFFGGHGTKGACPKGGSHNPQFSANYWLSFSPPGQSDWRWCKVCEGLFFAGNNTLGVCPGNPNGHDGSDSADYVLTHNAGPGQQDEWLWCKACQGLFFHGSGSNGVCPRNPNGHDGFGSGNYILSLAVN